MVNKRNTTYPITLQQENFNDYLRTENQSLKEENEELAKVLADTTMKYQKLMQTKLDMHQDLYSSDAEKIVYKEFIKSLGIEICEYIQKFCSLTEQVTTMLNKINLVVESPATYNDVKNSSTKFTPSFHKSARKLTSIVPLISGHTLTRPKFDSSGFSSEHLTDMTHLNTTGRVDDNTESDETEVSNNALSTSEDLLEENNRQIQKLEALQEAEGNQRNSSTSQSFLPDTFRDSKAYISPITSSDITQLRKKLQRRSFHTSNLSTSDLNPGRSLTPTRIPTTLTDTIDFKIPTTKVANYTAKLQKFSITQLKSLISSKGWDPPLKSEALLQKTRVNSQMVLENDRRNSSTRNSSYGSSKSGRAKKQKRVT